MDRFTFLDVHDELGGLAAYFSDEQLQVMSENEAVRDVFLFLFASSSVGDPEFLQQLREMTTFLLESDWLHKRDLAEFCVLLTHLLHFLEQAKIYVALPLIAPAPSRFEQRRRERDACLKAKKPALLARHKAQEMAGLLRDGLVMSETEAMRVIAGEYPIFLAFAGWLESKRPTFGDAPSRVADFFHQKSVDIVS